MQIERVFSSDLSSESRHACALSECWDLNRSLQVPRSACCMFLSNHLAAAQLGAFDCQLCLGFTANTPTSRFELSNVYDCPYLDVSSSRHETSSPQRLAVLSPWQENTEDQWAEMYAQLEVIQAWLTYWVLFVAVFGLCPQLSLLCLRIAVGHVLFALL